MEFQTVIIEDTDNGIRLDRYFKRYHPNMSFGTIAKLVRKKDIKVNGKRADVSQRLSTGDSIIYPILHIVDIDKQRPQPQFDANAENFIKEMVLFEDENIIVLNKVCGLAVQGGSKIKVSVDDLSIYLQDENGQKPKLVHRLDKDTSGLLILARSAKVASEVAEVIKHREFNKTYIALCMGRPKELSGKIDAPIEKVMDEITNCEKVKVHSQGKRAISYYEVVDHAADEYSLIKVQIITGRTHQIRVHLNSIECPIIGDGKYGMRSEISRGVASHLYLHAYQLNFTLGAQSYSFTAPLPAHFMQAMDDLGLRLT